VVTISAATVSQKPRVYFLKKEYGLECQLICELKTEQHPRPKDPDKDEPQTLMK